MRSFALIVALVVSLAVAGAGPTGTASADRGRGSHHPPEIGEIQSLTGAGNNPVNPTWGMAGADYPRLGTAHYADGIGEMVGGPEPRYVSNRVLNDTNQLLLSERNVSQWGFVWGQFLDHTLAQRLGRRGTGEPGEPANIPFDDADPLEAFTNELGIVFFERSAASPGTGETTPREQANTISSYLDAWTVYSGSEERLEWLREGPVDGDLSNNGARLLMPGDYLPRRGTRGDPDNAPIMVVGGRLGRTPDQAAVAGDARANENPPLTATHTLLAREHNRIVSLLPETLSEEDKFQIARRVVIAAQQYITYNEFLPAMGVTLPPYTGYDPTVRTDLSNEFATIGYRAHSMIRGEFKIRTATDRYSQDTLDAIAAHGIEVTVDGAEVELTMPLDEDAFFNPDLLELVQLGPLLHSLGERAQNNNDEQIDNKLRSAQVNISVDGNPDCVDDPSLPRCLDYTNDLGSVDIARGRDHGLPNYNELRQVHGLPPKTSFMDVTGEHTEEFPPGLGIDNPASMDFVELVDIDGHPIDLDSERAGSEAVSGTRATTLAARLKAIYGDVDDLDAFVGMVAEPHVSGTEFGELQLAAWRQQFAALRDGDRFFYGNDPGLSWIRSRYGIDYRRSLADLIADNTDISRSELSDNVFVVAGDPGSAACHVEHHITSQWRGGFRAEVEVTNTSDEPIHGWELGWRFATGQRVKFGWNGQFHQDGPDVAVTGTRRHRFLVPRETVDGVGYVGRWDSTTNAPVTHFTLNGARCTSG